MLLKYYLEITTQENNSPLTVELQNMSTGKMMTITNGRTDEIELPYESKETTNYKLTLRWDTNNKSAEYAGKNLKYTIKLIATQKKRMKVE